MVLHVAVTQLLSDNCDRYGHVHVWFQDRREEDSPIRVFRLAWHDCVKRR